MEDGSDGLSSEASNTQILKNGNIMAKLSEADVVEEKEGRSETPVKVNGSSTGGEYSFEEEDCDSSDCDALVIDEAVKTSKFKKNGSRISRCRGFRGFKNTTTSESFIHSNPYFSESIFDLLEKSQESKHELLLEKISDKKNNCTNNLKTCDKKVKSNPKLREYAQYLGLQPTVQFKCSKCLRAGFQSLQSLNEHLLQCNDSAPVDNLINNNSTSAPSTNIRVTRKVFLCSACGTYYENWNLFLHMREVHKRYICLYCLGMFSHPDKLSLHIISKHNCVPNHINTIEEFFNTHKEPCFLMCCECQKGFTERDNFFDHSCLDASASGKVSTVSKQTKVLKQKGIEHVTADTIDNVTATVIDEEEKYSSENVNKVTSSPKNERDCEDIGRMKIEQEENIKGDEIMQQEKRVYYENNLLMSKLTNSEFDDDNQKSLEMIICDNKETNDVNECSNVSEESAPKRKESISNEEQILNDGDSIEQDHLQSEDINDSIDMSVIEQNTEMLRESNSATTKEITTDIEVETRKVPKVTLKLPKTFDYGNEDNEDEHLPYDSEDSENLTMEVDQVENESETPISEANDLSVKSTSDNQLQIAGFDVPVIELELEQPLDKFDIRILLQKCLRVTIPTCTYCNHARRISVNGKQLGLHAIAEHRFSAVVNSITAEELIPESFVARIKDGLIELENTYFNLETNVPDEAITFSHVFECFQCRYSTTVHKELYLHNRKMHAKSILLCIMCKSNFYSYSELICHLCPGLYELERDIQFRCCMCVSDDLPSAFRLMVHLRKRHHACDVCLELCHNQSKLSNHVWKHKLHHLCYRCGIAYRNKPDITKHLYWKHGTESVTCKKCLQKKWPHVYHFCIPPPSFTCEECNMSFLRAVSLMVHKRFHSEDNPHICQEEGCYEKFVSKKLLLKHEFKHREPPEEAIIIHDTEKIQECESPQIVCSQSQNQPEETLPVENEEKTEKPKPKVDVYDLPELNLSESDSSDSDDENNQKKSNDTDSTEKTSGQKGDDVNNKDPIDLEKPAPVMGTIWDDFRNYQANKEKEELEFKQENQVPSIEEVLKDHDYCVLPIEETKEEMVLVQATEKHEGIQMSVDHDYCFGQKENIKDSKEKSPKKRTSSSSGSSSDSNSSSCTCGSNCSCSSSSGSSSSTSDSSESDSSSSEGRRKQRARRERRKQKLKNKNKENEAVDVVVTDNQPIITLDVPVQESDLETTESDTDEDFYDKQPQKLANKLLAEKKNQLLQMAAIGPYINGSIMDGSRPPTPSLPEDAKPKKKSKNKKRKKKNKSSKYQIENPAVDIPQDYQPMAPLTLTLPKNSPVTTPQYNSPIPNLPVTTVSTGQNILNIIDNDNNLRASKRKRVPNKFYGYSSDDEHEKPLQPPVLKWRKVDLPSPRSPLVVPPLTIKTIQTSISSIDPVNTRGTTVSVDSRSQHSRIFQQSRPPIIAKRRPPIPEHESATDSNDSSSEEDPIPAPPLKDQPALYCYCRCPYDEVSEMIGCDASDCAIEWFHFECVGIMVPPKGQWFCPDCRKKKQQRREALQNQS